MKRKFYPIFLVALLVSPVAADAAEDVDISGRVELGVRGVDDKNDSAHFQEFRDIDDGGFGSLLFRAYRDSYYLDFEGRNFGLDDQFYKLEGGDFKNFDATIWYDEIPHNITFDGLTVFTGLETSFLELSGPAPDDSNLNEWNRFDYKTKRKEYGGEVTVDLDTPFFLTVGAKKQDKDGLKPTSSGSFFPGAVELPEPIDYTTEDLYFTAGYRSKQLLVSVDGFLSYFNNENNFLDWDDPFEALSDDFTIVTLPPDNDYGKIAADATWKALPFSSVFSVRGSYAKLENDFSFSNLNIQEFAPATLNRTDFDGDIKYKTVYAALTSRPTRLLDTKLWYRYLDKENDSDIIENDIDGDGVIEEDDGDFTNAAELFDYDKNNAGFDVGVRLPMSTKGYVGYEYKDIDRRNRPIAENTMDHLGYVELKNHYLEYLTARVKYQRLERDADSGMIIEPGVDATDPFFIRLFLDRFDVTDKSMDEIEVAFDLYPMPNLDVGLEYRYKMNDYDETVIGRTEDKRHEFYGDVVLRMPKWGTLTGFGGYEIIQSDSTHFSHFAGSGTPPQLANPLVEDGNPDSFIWTDAVDDDYWTYGVSAYVPLIPQMLDFNITWRYEKNDGDQDFTTQGEEALVDIAAFDDYSRDWLEAKLIYAFSSNIDIALGYIYEDFDHHDLQLDNYDFLVDTGQQAFLTGAYSDYDYEAQVGYLLVSYEF